jgi:hypothetical protein
MSKLITAHVAAGAAAVVLVCGAVAAATSCAAIWDIEEPLPLVDGGGADATVTDSAVPVEEESSIDAGRGDTSAVDADAATLDARDAADAPDGPLYPDAGYTVTLPPPPPFIDACSLSGHINVLVGNTNSDTGKIPLPIAFAFYGVPQTAYWANTKGVVGFDGRTSHLGTFMCPLPQVTFDPYPAVYAFADDLATGSGICIGVDGTKPNQRLVITWEDANLVSNSSSHLTFSVVLTETANTIEVLYDTMTGGSEAQGSKATIGLEDKSGTLATNFSCDKAVITSTPFAILFTPNP